MYRPWVKHETLQNGTRFEPDPDNSVGLLIDALSRCLGYVLDGWVDTVFYAVEDLVKH